MKSKTLTEQVATIRQAFGYVSRFGGRTFVIKIDDGLLSHRFFPLLVRDIASLHRLGIRIVLVPGARRRIDRLLKDFGHPCRTIRGVRVSSAKAMPTIEMAASDIANRIMTLLAESDVQAVVGNWVRARAIGVRGGIDYQRSGLVVSLKSDMVRNVLRDGVVPVFPNIGWSSSGTPYNISSDGLALAVARELSAAKLFLAMELDAYTTDRFRSPDGASVNEDGVIGSMTVSQAREFVRLNRCAKGLSTELGLVIRAVQACEAGTARVHIVDGRIEGIILKEIFSNRGLGTMVYANEHDNIRPATRGDIPEMLRIMRRPARQGIIRRRTADHIEQTLKDYAIYEVDGTIHGCAAMHPLGGKQAELAALVVDEAYASMGTGRKLVTYLLDRAKAAGMTRAFVLTTHASDWFEKQGFKAARPADLPKKRLEAYDNKRGSRVLACDLRRGRGPRRLAVE